MSEIKSKPIQQLRKLRERELNIIKFLSTQE